MILAATAMANAADVEPGRLVPFRAATAVPLYSWNGLYAGLLAGYGVDNSRASTNTTSSVFDRRGANFGGTFGANLQVNSFVLGLEGDVSWNGLRGSDSNIVCVTRCETSSEWMATARGRVGYAFDRFLPYLTGGGAGGDVRIAQSGGGSASTTRGGWTAGAGLEYAFAGGWSAKLEYLYVDLGSATCGAGCAAGAAFDVNIKTNLARGGVNYRF